MKDDRITRAVGLGKKIVGHFSHSWKAKAKLKETQKEMELPEHSLITDCATRWGTKQKMIERMLEQRRALTDVLSGDRKARHLVPSWQDIEVLESVHHSLRPLQEFTDALSGESYVSVSSVKPILNLLETVTLADDEEDTDLSRSIKRRILDYLNDKYSDTPTQVLLDKASFLDPRYKATYCSNSSDVARMLADDMKIQIEKVGENYVFYNIFNLAN